jgi:HEAT repeat protein
MRARLVLLGAQTMALGLTVAFLVVPASALLLHAYGANTLPYVYLVVAVSGVLVSWAMRRAQSRLSLAALAVLVLGGYAVLVAAGYTILVATDAEWVTFPLVVLFPLAIPVGFVLVGAQAGRLLDVRQMKERFPRVVAGFSLGFAVGGLLAAGLVKLLPRVEDLLLVDVLTAAAMIALVVATARRYPEQLKSRPTLPARLTTTEPAPRRMQLSRFLGAIFAYQLLSAAVTQLFDYIVWNRAAARFPDADDLAHFQGLYGAAINMVSIAFVVLLAGRLLRRWGVGLGLSANPGIAVLTLVVGNVVGWSAGIAGLAFLLVACSQQIGDIMTTDGMTRTAMNTTYQALPVDQRLRAQTLAEAAGVPLALGLVGGMLLLFRGLDLGIRTVELVTLVASVTWLALAVVVFREYGAGLRKLVMGRAWEPTALDVEGEEWLDAVQRLLDSSDHRDVEVGLEALAASQTPAFAAQVGALLSDETPSAVRASAARATLVSDVSTRADVTRRLLDDPDPGVQATVSAACVDEPGHLGERSREVWSELVCHDDPDVSGHALRAAASTPSPFFVPHLIEAAARPGHEGAVSHALAAHAEHLGPAVRTVLVDRDGGRRVRERVVRAMTAAHGRVEPVAFDVAPVLEDQRVRAARARAALSHLDESPPLAPLRRALLDDLGALADETIALLSLATGQRGLARAVRALHSDDATERALAHETLEVTVGHQHAAWVIDLVQGNGLHQVDQPEQVSDWLADLVQDPDEFWQEPWLRVCALYAAPTVLGDAAAPLATPWVDDPDPMVAETARWVVDH